MGPHSYRALGTPDPNSSAMGESTRHLHREMSALSQTPASIPQGRVPLSLWRSQDCVWRLLLRAVVPVLGQGKR